MTIQKIRLAVDAVVFGYDRQYTQIGLLLIKRKIEPFINQWALPGGLVLNEESLEEAVSRELQEETGVTINYLEQLYTFGTPNRDPRNRVVSVAYFGLVRPDMFTLHASTDALAAEWFEINNLPPLAFDHQKIIDVALERLRSKVRYEPIGFELLEEKFPFSDLEKLYTTLLQEDIDRRNFKKKLMSLGVIEELQERYTSGAGRPAKLYRFNRKEYFELKEMGGHFSI